MACTALTKGRGLDCNRISGGIKNIYFGVYDKFVDPIDGTGIAQSSGEITDIEMVAGTGSGLFRYTTPLGVASITETITGSRENGTIFYTPTVNIMLNKLTKEDQNEIKLLGKSKVRIFAELNQQLTNGHNVFIALGMDNGLELNAGTMDSGAAFGDRNGYSLTAATAGPTPTVADWSMPNATGQCQNLFKESRYVDGSTLTINWNHPNCTSLLQTFYIAKGISTINFNATTTNALTTMVNFARQAPSVNSITFGSNVDFSGVTTMQTAFYQMKGGISNIAFDSGADFSSITTLSSIIGPGTRGMSTAVDSPTLQPNVSNAEGNAKVGILGTGTGFQVNETNGTWNAAGCSYIYVAIAAPVIETMTAEQFAESQAKFLTYNNRKQVKEGEEALQARTQMLAEAGNLGLDLSEVQRMLGK